MGAQIVIKLQGSLIFFGPPKVAIMPMEPQGDVSDP